MSQSSISTTTLFSPHASLAAIVAQLKARGIFDAVRTGVHIAQKTVKDSPQEKLLDILLTLLSGAQSLVQINTLLRSDPALQHSAGRERCCEQSVAQQTLDAATAENVEQMQQILTTLFRQHSQAASHSFRHGNWLILDVDLTGMPCGKKAEKSVKGYFHDPRTRRGRQQARVLASQYDEIVADELYPGNTILLSVLPSLIEKAEHILGLTPWKRQHTILRIDAGGGTVDMMSSLLDRGYVVVSKEYSAARTNQLVKRVKEWVEESGRPERQMGWVQEETWEYRHPVRRLAVRNKNRKGQWHSGILLFAGVSQKHILKLMGASGRADEASILRAYAHFYDQRGAGVETSFGEDKRG